MFLMASNGLLIGLFCGAVFCLLVSIADIFACPFVVWLYGSINEQDYDVTYHLYPNKFCMDANIGFHIQQCLYQSDFCNAGDSDSSVEGASVEELSWESSSESEESSESDGGMDKVCNAIKRGKVSQGLFIFAGVVGILGIALGAFDWLKNGQMPVMLYAAFGCEGVMLISTITAATLEYFSCHDVNDVLKENDLPTLGYGDGTATFIVASVFGVAAVIVHGGFTFFRKMSSSGGEETTPLRS